MPKNREVFSVFELFRQSAAEMKRVPSVLVAALLIALNLVIHLLFTTYLSPTLRVTFGFLAMAVVAARYGPVVGIYASAVNDILSYILKPGGPFFIGFTISAMLTGLLYGVVLYRKPLSWWRTGLAQLFVTVLINLGLNTLWLSILYNKGALGLLVARFAKNVAMFPIEVLLLYTVLTLLTKALAKIRPGQ